LATSFTDMSRGSVTGSVTARLPQCGGHARKYRDDELAAHDSYPAKSLKLPSRSGPVLLLGLVQDLHASAGSADERGAYAETVGARGTEDGGNAAPGDVVAQLACAVQHCVAQYPRRERRDGHAVGDGVVYQA